MVKTDDSQSCCHVVIIVRPLSTPSDFRTYFVVIKGEFSKADKSRCDDLWLLIDLSLSSNFPKIVIGLIIIS